MPILDLLPEWLATVRHILAEHIPEAEVLAYGSRVQGTAHEGSDLDLVGRDPVAPGQPQQSLAGLREALSSSNLPILVEVLDWAQIPETFRQEILRGGAVLVQGLNEGE